MKTIVNVDLDKNVVESLEISDRFLSVLMLLIYVKATLVMESVVKKEPSVTLMVETVLSENTKEDAVSLAECHLLCSQLLCCRLEVARVMMCDDHSTQRKVTQRMSNNKCATKSLRKGWLESLEP